MPRGTGRHNWRLILDGRQEIGRWRATTAEKLIDGCWVAVYGDGAGDY